MEGRVQGVGFRWWTRTHALRLGISGTVGNAREGHVEIRARGTPEALEELRRLLEQGPTSARVERVIEEDDEDVPAHGFEVVRI